jgi:hypothetical protein
MVAYRRPSNGRELLSGLYSSQNINTNNFLSFIPNDGWRLRDCGHDKNSPKSIGDIRERSYIPESGLVC